MKGEPGCLATILQNRPQVSDEELMTPSLSAAKPPTERRPGRARVGEPYAVVGSTRNEGHGKRLTAAFEAHELFPALAESRNRVLALVSGRYDALSGNYYELDDDLDEALAAIA